MKTGRKQEAEDNCPASPLLWCHTAKMYSEVRSEIVQIHHHTAFKVTSRGVECNPIGDGVQVSWMHDDGDRNSGGGVINDSICFHRKPEGNTQRKKEGGRGAAALSEESVSFHGFDKITFRMK